MSNIWRKFGWWWCHLNGFVRGPYSNSQEAFDGLLKMRKDPRYD